MCVCGDGQIVQNFVFLDKTSDRTIIFRQLGVCELFKKNVVWNLHLNVSTLQSLATSLMICLAVVALYRLTSPIEFFQILKFVAL